jgi:hypothetical protein
MLAFIGAICYKNGALPHEVKANEYANKSREANNQSKRFP